MAETEGLRGAFRIVQEEKEVKENQLGVHITREWQSSSAESW